MQGWPGELQQVIANLISNAADAVDKGGKLSVSVTCVDDDNNLSNTAVLLRVEDDGHGIPPEHLERIFEPFFTTKKDVGTGLGLWVSKEIVERHGGKIQVASHNNGNGRGTTFRVLLPCIEDRQRSATVGLT